MSESRQRSTGPIVQLFGVARGLEDEGRYNEAKFYRAAGFAELVRIRSIIRVLERLGRRNVGIRGSVA